MLEALTRSWKALGGFPYYRDQTADAEAFGTLEYVSTEEAAHLIDRSARRVRQLVDAGQLIGRRVGGRREVLLDSIGTLLEERAQKETA